MVKEITKEIKMKIKMMNDFTKDELEIAKICLVHKCNVDIPILNGYYNADVVLDYLNDNDYLDEVIKGLSNMLFKATKWMNENNNRHIVISLINKLK